jgi:hypothetical protein
MVGIGLISYSAYLWHQPMFALARHRSVEEPGAGVFAVLSIAALVLAWFSWRYIEAPFRNKRTIGRNGIFAFAAGGTVLYFCLGVSGIVTDGFLHREKWKGLDNAFAVQTERGSGEKYCHAHRVDSPLGPLVCVIGDTSKKPDGVLWGDSYAGALMFGMDAELKRLGRAFYVVSSDGCVPVEGLSRVVMREEFGCTEKRHADFVAQVLRDPGLQNIVWVGRFAGALKASSSEFVINGVKPTHTLIKEQILETLKKFKQAGKHVVFIGETPHFPQPVADHAIRTYASSDGDIKATIQRVGRRQMAQELDDSDILEAAGSIVPVIDGLDLFCDERVCVSHDANDRLLFIDNGHLSHLGSTRLAQAVVGQLY